MAISNLPGGCGLGLKCLGQPPVHHTPQTLFPPDKIRAVSTEKTLLQNSKMEKSYENVARSHPVELMPIASPAENKIVRVTKFQ